MRNTRAIRMCPRSGQIFHIVFDVMTVSVMIPSWFSCFLNSSGPGKYKSTSPCAVLQYSHVSHITKLHEWPAAANALSIQKSIFRMKDIACHKAVITEPRLLGSSRAARSCTEVEFDVGWKERNGKILPPRGANS